MKRTILMAIGALVLTGATAATAQSLGDYARNVRKNKPQPSTTGRYYDNDNLPADGQLSVVGPAPAAPSPGPKVAKAASAAQTEQQKAGEKLQKQIKEQQEQIESLSHELDLDQREYRLRVAEFYSDAGNRLRNAAQWDKDDAQYKADMDAKQKAIDAAKQQLSELQEQARKAGLSLKEDEKDSTDKDKGK